MINGDGLFEGKIYSSNLYVPNVNVTNKLDARGDFFCNQIESFYLFSNELNIDIIDSANNVFNFNSIFNFF